MHAVLITAYKDFEVLERLVRRLDPAFFSVFIHIDLRSSITSTQVERLKAIGCTVIRKYRIRWAALSHLHAILDLLAMAAEHDFDYVHIISGQDYPVASIEDFQARCDGSIFMVHEPLAEASDYLKERYGRYNFLHFLQSGPPFSGTVHKYLDRISLALQRWLGIQRHHFSDFKEIHKGIVWMSFPLAAGRQLLADARARSFLKSIRTTYVAEEIYFQSYFLNSDFAPRVVNNDLRYTDWIFRNGSMPAYLDESDVQKVQASGALFARKVSSVISQEFLARIDETVSPTAESARRKNSRAC